MFLASFHDAIIAKRLHALPELGRAASPMTWCGDSLPGVVRMPGKLLNENVSI